MKKFFKRTAAGVFSFAVLAGLIPAVPVSAAGSITINEVCTKNTTYPAPDGGFYDWVEIFNSSSSAVDISGWGLSDKDSNPYRFTFPQGTSVPANGHIIVFCDGDAGLNNTSIAPFGLSASGETLILTDKGGAADNVTVDPLASDASFGRYPDGASEFFVLSATPKAANTAPEGSNAVKKPEFSQESGFYNSSFDLTISVPQGTTVYYTTDGSDPTTESDQYTAPIRIDDMTNTENRLSMRRDISTNNVAAPKELIDKAAVVRAIAVDSQGRISPVATKTYFVGTTASSYYKSMKVVSLVTDPDNLFDAEKGIYVLGNTYNQGGGQQNPGWGWQQPVQPNQPNQPGQEQNDPAQPGGNRNNIWGGLQINADEPANPWGGGNWGNFNAADMFKVNANFTQKGIDWEREASFELFENGEKVVDQNVGIRVKGAYSRNAVQKSFNIIARMDYGKAELEYDFFDGTATKAKNGKKIKTFDSVTIRNGGNDVGAAYFRDTINQSLVADRAFAHQAMSECVLFIDGEFWGVYQLTEKVSDDYISSHYGIKKSDVVIVKNDELEEGTEADFNEWNSLISQFASADMTNASNYSQFCEKFDIRSFVDYFTAQIYWSNSDWPQNNLAAWKTNALDETNPYADGKWRMVLFDTESGQGLYNSANNNVNSNPFSRISMNNDSMSRLFNNLLKNDDFRKQFELTMMDLANYNFDPEKVTPVIEHYKNTYKQQILDTYERFFSDSQSGQRGEEKLNNEYNTITNFYKGREQYVTQNMKQALKLTGNLANLSISNSADKGTVCVNTLTLDGLSSWSGEYFTDFPVTVKAVANEGSTFDHWEVTGADIDSSKLKSDELEIPLSGDVTVRAVYSGEASSTTTTQQPANTKVKGDYNGDGKTDTADLVILSQFLHGKKVDIKPADVIEDGLTDTFDLIALRKMLIK